MKHSFTLFILILFLIGCSSKQAIYIEFDRVDGLSNNSSIIFKGLEVGQVEEISINESGQIIVEALIEKEFIFPKNYELLIYSTSILGSKDILIHETNEPIKILEDGVLKGSIEDESKLDTITNRAVRMIDEVARKMDNKDSLLIELRRLNKNIEELKGKN
jgi:hypothetical protein